MLMSFVAFFYIIYTHILLIVDNSPFSADYVKDTSDQYILHTQYIKYLSLEPLRHYSQNYRTQISRTNGATISLAIFNSKYQNAFVYGSRSVKLLLH